MSWFKKAATDDGGLNVSKVPTGAMSWQVDRRRKRRKRRRDVRKEKLTANN